MLAAIIDAPGAEPRLGSVVLAPQSAGTTLVGVIAAPLNPLDLLIASGTFHSARHEAPYVPGSECVGMVLASDSFSPGSLVYAECHATPAAPGCFAAQVLVADEDVLPLPKGMDPVLAAAVGNSGTAASTFGFERALPQGRPKLADLVENCPEPVGRFLNRNRHRYSYVVQPEHGNPGQPGGVALVALLRSTSRRHHGPAAAGIARLGSGRASRFAAAVVETIGRSPLEMCLTPP